MINVIIFVAAELSLKLTRVYRVLNLTRSSGDNIILEFIYQPEAYNLKLIYHPGAYIGLEMVLSWRWYHPGGITILNYQRSYVFIFK